MSDFKIYEVYVPIEGQIKIHLRAEDKFDAVHKATKIAVNMKEDGADAIVPNLYNWWINVNKVISDTDSILVIEKGESDE